MTEFAPLHLPRLTRGEARLLSQAAGALAATRPAERDHTGGWIVLKAEPGGWTALIAPVSAAERPLGPIDPADGAHAALAMEAVEPLIAALEAAWRVSLRPERVEAAAPELATEIERDGCVALLAVSAEVEPAGFASAAPEPDRMQGVPVATEWRLRAASLSPARVASLADGDLLLVQRELPAALSSGAMRWAARADLSTMTLTLLQPEDLPMSAEPSVWAEARTPVELVIDAGALPVGRLAALTAGSVLTLDQPKDVVPVEIRAGGMRIGRGELVAVGDAFGVVLTAVEGATTDRVEAPAAAETAEA